MPSATTVVFYICILASFTLADVDCTYTNLIGGATSWFGAPRYDDCRRLIYGNNDLSGIAQIDDLSHAFIPSGASQEQESNQEWGFRVVLPKFWANRENVQFCGKTWNDDDLTFEQEVVRSP